MSSPTRERRRDETLARFFLVLADRLILNATPSKISRGIAAQYSLPAHGLFAMQYQSGVRAHRPRDRPRERRQQSRDRVHPALIVFGVREAELAIASAVRASTSIKY